MAGSTAQGLYDNLMLDLMPSPAQMTDFGIDMATNRDALMRAYQRGIKNGTITVELLSEAVCDGAKLSKLVGMEVETMWDELNEFDYDDDDDEDDDEQ